MSDSGHVIGENNPYHSNFNGSLIDELAKRDEAIADLRAKLAEAEQIIATHDLCHDLHGKVGPAEFATGCEAEQRKLFGCAPHADRVAELEAKLSEAEAKLDRELSEALSLNNEMKELFDRASDRADSAEARLAAIAERVRPYRNEHADLADILRLAEEKEC